MRIGIIGCGTAGPAAAIFLARSGHAVTLLERVAEPRPVGAGLLIQPIGQAILHRLGLLDSLANLAAPVHRIHGHTHRGRTVMHLRYADLRPDLLGMGISRPALFSTLITAAQQAGATMLFGQACTSISQTDSAAFAHTADTTHGPFDLILVTDGARSSLRPASLIRRDAQYPWGALWFTAPLPDDSFDGVLDQTYRDTRQMLGFLPIGRFAHGQPRSLAIFWSLPIAAAVSVRARPLDEWKQAVKTLSPRAAPLLDHVTTWDDLALAPYHDTVLTRWHDRRVVYLGDAAHAMSPQLGMGANLALADAAILADCLAETPANLPQALATYSNRRRATLRYYQTVSRLMTPWFQSAHSWMAPIRNFGLPIAYSLPPLRKEMLNALVGSKAGWLATAPISQSSELWRASSRQPVT